MSGGCYSIIIIILLQFSPTQTTASDFNQDEVQNEKAAPFITRVKNKGKKKTKTNNHLQFRCAFKRDKSFFRKPFFQKFVGTPLTGGVRG
jgi:hypothetical protein